MTTTIAILHHQQRREFILSTRTKPNALKLLIRRAFNLTNDVRELRQADARWSLEEVLSAGQGEYELQLEDSEQGRSETCSQKNMSKVSGRKNPPSENELLESKFYIDDFQLFMSEVSHKQSHRFFGIVFFNSRKKASFLGKKILRELVYEFHQVEFFYALHPIKVTHHPPRFTLPRPSSAKSWSSPSSRAKTCSTNESSPNKSQPQTKSSSTSKTSSK